MAKQVTRKTDTGLEALFDAARQTAPEPGVDFLSRVLADAEAVQQAIVARDATGQDVEAGQVMAARPVVRAGMLRRLLRRMDIFGTHGLVGSSLAAAAVLGFGIGFSGGVSGASWMSALAPSLFDEAANVSMTLLPESDSFVISLGDQEGMTP